LPGLYGQSGPVLVAYPAFEFPVSALRSKQYIERSIERQQPEASYGGISRKQARIHGQGQSQGHIKNGGKAQHQDGIKNFRSGCNSEASETCSVENSSAQGRKDQINQSRIRKGRNRQVQRRKTRRQHCQVCSSNAGDHGEVRGRKVAEGGQADSCCKRENTRRQISSSETTGAKSRQKRGIDPLWRNTKSLDYRQHIRGTVGGRETSSGERQSAIRGCQPHADYSP